MAYNPDGIVNHNSLYPPTAPYRVNTDIPVCYPNENSINNQNNTSVNMVHGQIPIPISLNINITKNKKKYKQSESKTNDPSENNIQESTQRHSETSLRMFTREEREEIVNFGLYLGVNLVKYPFCLKYVLEAMNAMLPENWEEKISNKGEKFFFHNKLFISTWNHPLDSFYREFIEDEIKKYKKDNRKGCTIM